MVQHQTSELVEHLQKQGDIYKKIVLSQVPRILGFGDRAQHSRTFGCFDRYYWHYKLIDFPNARFQEVVLLLALLYKENFEGNIYSANDRILEWILGAMEFWIQNRNRNGSVNEAYPYECSFCATSFTTYAIAEGLISVDSDYFVDLEQTGNWLSRNNNIEVSNQMAAAILALYNIALITGKKKYLAASKEKLTQVIEHQTIEGFYPEYDGPDIGYHTLTLSCLAKYYKKSQDASVLDSLKRAAKWAEEIITDNGSFDYSNTTRKTQFLYPHGFAILRSDVVNRHIKGLERNEILNPGWLDDRYVIPLTTDYLQTYLELKNADDNN